MTTTNKSIRDSSAVASTGAPTVILGGTGKTGRRITDRLRAAKIPVRSVARSTAIPFDWADRNTWNDAIAGSRQAYIAYSPDLAAPAALREIAEITQLLVEHGVHRIVVLSGRGEPEALAAEHVVATSGVDWTVLRCSWFNQNFSEGYLRDAILNGSIALPAGTVSEPFVDADDIADVAVAALTQPGHGGEVFELTGPELLTFHQIAETVTEYTGRLTEYVPISAGDFSRGARADGVPDEVVMLLDYLFRVVLDGRNESLTDGVQRALQREPRSFRDFAQDAATSGLWRR